jgi:type III secretory pathway component EscV
VSGIDWTNVLDTLIVAIPAIIAAIYAGRVHSKVKTPSGKSIGKQVEDTLHTSISNHHYAAAISEKVGASPSPQANGEAEKVAGLTEGEGV